MVAVLYTQDLRAISSLTAHRELGQTTRFSEFRSFDTRYNKTRYKKWETAVLANLNERVPDPHSVFGPARGAIGSIIRSPMKTEFGKRRAARALANAIAHEVNRLGIDYFARPRLIDFKQLNDDLVVAFEKEWAIGN